MTLAGRVALVTGASRGVGRGIALALAADGADIAVNYRREEDAALEVVDEIRRLGRRAHAYHALVYNPDENEEMIARIEAELGPVGILINNAALPAAARR